MTFQEKLANLKERIETNIPARQLEIMHNATKQLQESGIEDNVLEVGDKLPEFELPNQKGEHFKSTDLYKDGALVITFYRGLWCPYCNADLGNLKKYVPEIEKAGGKMIAISPEKQEYSNKIIQKHKLNFDILTDARNEVASQFGLRFKLPQDLIDTYKVFSIDLEMYNGNSDWTLPMPARFLVGTDGVIHYAECSADYTKRPDPDALMEELLKLV